MGQRKKMEQNWPYKVNKKQGSVCKQIEGKQAPAVSDSSLETISQGEVTN
jgi:hypothetical protein